MIPEIKPWYRGFEGTIEKSDKKYITYGVINKIKDKVEVSELPIGMWTDKFKETAEDWLVDKKIKNMKNYSTPKKVNFLITDGTKLVLPNASISAVFSCHVFQHFDSTEDAARVFQELHRVLIPGGSICIHLPLFELPASPIRPFLRLLLHAWKQAGNFRALIQRMRNAPLMRGLPYELLPLRKSLAALGFSQIETHGFCMRSDHAWHEVLFARKDSPSSTP